MSELLPTLQAGAIRHSLTDYLTTTFALTDAGAQSALDDFLSAPDSGMFKGPYVRLRLPFRPADSEPSPLEWLPPGFTPYGHQAAAFSRLASAKDGQPRRPSPTLVTTGTGSGKTEAFLYPILDHVLRARKQGVTGMKALILYPMNALANDQAGRLAGLIASRPELAAVTAGLYTGQDQTPRHKVTAEGLITDRYEMRENPPDILLTNYKMLDQLLLRADDQGLWRESAHSLRYLVLDEFHTYDGAQGTDVAMLLRRLGLALKALAGASLTEQDLARPPGRLTPVATSATLGGENPAAMLEFARTVFGEEFGADSIVSESRLSLAEWVGDAPEQAAVKDVTPIEAGRIRVAEFARQIRALGDNPECQELTSVVLGGLFQGDTPGDATWQETLLKAHPLVRRLVDLAGQAQALPELPGAVLGGAFTAPLAATGRDRDWETVLGAVIAALGHVRAQVGRQAVSVEVHYWLRELTRIDRVADTAAAFRWSDDGPAAADDATAASRPAFPAIYCRRCGRSGWAVKLAPVGHDLAADDSTIRQDQFHKSGRVRALIHAPGEAEVTRLDQVEIEGLRWFSVKDRQILADAPDETNPDFLDGWVLPVLTLVGDQADSDSSNETCPSCGQSDAIRFLGSAIATLLSVSLSTLFGSPKLDAKEKRALVFTDSVQDAAHRAGFVQARAHIMTLRSTLRAALEDGELSLVELVTEAIAKAGDDKSDRYRLLPPDCAERDSFRPFWEKATVRGVPATVRLRVSRRMAFDAALEFGLNSRLGRTLELTGSVSARVEAGTASRIAKLARDAIEAAGWQAMLDQGETAAVADKQLVAWARGVLERIRTQGGIDHPWLERYRLEDGRRFLIWGGRPRAEGMPAFPRGRPAPAFPRVGGRAAGTAQGDGLDAVANTKSWYAIWTAKALGATPHDAAKIVPRLLKGLAEAQVLTEVVSKSNARVYGIPASNVILAPISDEALAAGCHMLECSTCKALTPGHADTVGQLEGAPCLASRCQGLLERKPALEGFYRRMYRSFSMRRIVAREHTGLLDDKTRLAYEEGFKKSDDNPGSPNVLVATPTLEMGIDIGDLSAVFLASLPKTVAAYTQRLGRAGRLTGNALSLTYVTGRGEHLPKLGDPLSVIDGEVRPPATYLAAEEILRRQYTAALVDTFARDPKRPHPKKATGALGSTDPGTFLGDLIALGERRGAEFDRFAEAFLGVGPASLEMLRAWLAPDGGPATSRFAAHLIRASQAWRKLVEMLRFRLQKVNEALPELEKQANSPAHTEDDVRAWRSAQAAARLAAGQRSRLTGEYWIAVLEEYGILPNYTLLDEIATLDVGMSWTDPETGQIATDHLGFQRGATLALREFAPGAQFYARGLQIAVDAVDLGMGAEAVREWSLCAACGYGKQLDATENTTAMSECPRCGDNGIADSGQRLEILELTHSTAEIRRDEAMISDRDDERERANFEVITTADLDPAGMGARWGEQRSGFSSTYYRTLTIRWLNLGQPPHGSSVTIASDTRPAKLFRVCEGCGKLDKETGLNSPHEHRAWCPNRTRYREQTRTIALSHTLRTQGLVLRLPQQITLADEFTMPSLSAAIRLGLRERIGGEVDHLAIVAVKAPQPGGHGIADALLLHDLVPGGTGYLTDWAAPARMHDLLASAWRIVKDCECRAENRLACHRCLLPFAMSSRHVSFTSRATAERHLATLLGIDETRLEPDSGLWELTEDIDLEQHSDAESVLEQRFRKALLDRFKAVGATVKETPGALGNTASITLAGSARHWTLRPQLLMGATCPDFVLESNDPNIPWVAIYTDGWRYHASQAHNRLADDAVKRAGLRAEGHVVLGVTSADVDAAEAKHPGQPVLDSALIGQAMRQPALQATPRAYQSLGVNPIDWLIDWLTNPDRNNTTKAARAVPLAFLQEAKPAAADKDEALPGVARRALRGEPDPESIDQTRSVAVWREGRLAASIELLGQERIGISLVLDDAQEAVNQSNAAAWREWLRFSNAMALRDWPTTITTCSLVETGTAEQVAPSGGSDDGATDLPAAWAERLGATATPAERELLKVLADAGLSTLPVVGEESPEGIPLSIAWPAAKIVIEVAPMRPEDRADLEAAGWKVLKADAGGLVSELARAGVS
ncbi:MAG: DEAD/DEAH box helicase [Bifidobacteriaceae bacterium]|jgi:ATP-dependent helicase YprA (DUF1998 family)/predicted RNA-binding Zn-ribbon protein involved in translation (DUF1610 family)|nr:DEAD/DEAH box helicase [Bifidobacteriaceae bacterium]